MNTYGSNKPNLFQLWGPLLSGDLHEQKIGLHSQYLVNIWSKLGQYECILSISQAVLQKCTGQLSSFGGQRTNVMDWFLRFLEILNFDSTTCRLSVHGCPQSSSSDDDHRMITIIIG